MARYRKKKIEGEYTTWGDDVKCKKLRKNAKFTYKYVEVAARLVAAGHSEEDLGFVFGVSPSTIHSWKDRYPQFQKACENGKNLAKNYAVAQGLRTAAGYDYEEVHEEYERKDVTDPDTGEVKTDMVLTKRKIANKHVPANPTLNMFYVCNLDPTFQSLKSVQIDASSQGVMGIQLSGDDMAAGLAKLCSGLFGQPETVEAKKVESTVIDDKKPKEGDSNQPGESESVKDNTITVESQTDLPAEGVRVETVSEPVTASSANIPDLFSDE